MGYHPAELTGWKKTSRPECLDPSSPDRWRMKAERKATMSKPSATIIRRIMDRLREVRINVSLSDW